MDRGAVDVEARGPSAPSRSPRVFGDGWKQEDARVRAGRAAPAMARGGRRPSRSAARREGREGARGAVHAERAVEGEVEARWREALGAESENGWVERHARVREAGGEGGGRLLGDAHGDGPGGALALGPPEGAAVEAGGDGGERGGAPERDGVREGEPVARSGGRADGVGVGEGLREGNVGPRAVEVVDQERQRPSCATRGRTWFPASNEGRRSPQGFSSPGWLIQSRAIGWRESCTSTTCAWWPCWPVRRSVTVASWPSADFQRVSLPSWPTPWV